MTANIDPLLSAYVLLEPGAKSDEAVRAFTTIGFSVDQVDSRGFSIAGPKSSFDQIFQRSFSVMERGGVHMFGPNTPSELPLGVLPAELRGAVQRIVVTTADFGPGSYSTF